MTTASALCTQAASRFRDAGGNVDSAAQWLAYLNQAYKAANSVTPLWPWNESSMQTVTVLQGARSVTLPTDMWQVNWVYDHTDDYRLIPQEGRGDQWHQDHLQSEDGQVVTYKLRGNQLEVFPEPNYDTVLYVEGQAYPAALNALTNLVTSHAGAAAGNVTATGVAVGDVLVSVVGVKDSDQTVHDYTSEFTITAPNVINNSGGTTSSGYHLVVTYNAPSGADSPVWPAQFHEILLDGMLAIAYLDDGNSAWHDVHQKRFEASIVVMKNSLLLFRTETNVPIRDVMWS